MPWNTPLTWGKTVTKGGAEMLYLLFLSSSPGRGSTDLLVREVPSLLYGKNTRLHPGRLGKERRENRVPLCPTHCNRTKWRGHYLDCNLRISRQLRLCVCMCVCVGNPQEWDKSLIHLGFPSIPKGGWITLLLTIMLQYCTRSPRVEGGAEISQCYCFL